MIEKTKKIFSKINRFKREKFKGKTLIIFVLAYFGALLVYMLMHNMWLSMDQFIILGFLLALLVAQPLIFLRDWIPFAFLFLSYEFLRGFAGHLADRAHIFSMVRFDNAIFFGKLPSSELQKLLYIPGHLHFYDYIFSVLYMLHFALPFVFGFILWLNKRSEYWKFIISLLILSYISFITYVIYPAMPPWMASQNGFIPEVHDVFGAAFGSIVKGPAMPSIYNFMNANPVAAMPSLHAAYPFLVYLFMRRIYGRKANFFLIYVFAVFIGVIYLGQHYIIDVLVGILYTYLSFKGVLYFFERRENRKKLQLDKKPA